MVVAAEEQSWQAWWRTASGLPYTIVASETGVGIGVGGVGVVGVVGVVVGSRTAGRGPFVVACEVPWSS